MKLELELMWGSRRERKSLSRILEMLFRFEIGRKLAGSEEGSPGDGMSYFGEWSECFVGEWMD